MKPTLPLLLGATLVLAACANTQQDIQSSTPKNVQQHTEQSFSPRPNTGFISQEQAQYRSSRLSQVNYNLDFNLSDNEVFSATAELAFVLKGIKHPITIDLNKAQIHTMSVNGNRVQADYNQSFITIEPTFLHHGNNVISIDYSRTHSTNGEGLHRFKDSVDGRVYLYSHFEPVGANQMFPSFDQPDLKATYTVTATAPQDWQVISTMRESSTSMVEGKKRWVFDKTPKLSTYNFSLHAGPYKVWHDNTGKYPARLFARQSVVDKVVPQDWFTFTQQGLTFFDKYFGIDYPFKKYDQILVPDFLYGAMENAAAVTFAERAFLSNGKMSAAREQRLAQVIMHEMAHQWFGDLVTMKWWNGLWLNESFAAFMATLATAQATKFDYAWRTFYADEKQKAYVADQRITTHPIEAPVASTANAFDNIDAITYSKGASVLVQLRHLLTPEVFRQGVHNYLVNYSYKNATLADFINSLSKTANRDLSQWKQQWLYQPGVNTIAAQYHCVDNAISAFSIKQSASQQYPILREQKVNVGLFNLDASGQLKLSKSIPVIYNGKITQAPDLIGSPCPDLVYPNYQDWAFVKVALDDKSFTTAQTAISKVSDTLLRSMLWQSLWDSVSDGLLPLNEYLDVVLKNVAMEQDYTTLNQLLGNVRVSIGYLNQFGQRSAQYHSKIMPKLEQMIWQAVLSNKDKPNHLRSWFDNYTRIATSPDALQRLKAILAGDLVVENLPFNQSMRWRIIRTLNRNNSKDSFELIDIELEKDNSDLGQKQAIAAKISRPDEQQKQYWLAQFASEKPDYPLSKLRIAMTYISPKAQTELTEKTADDVMAKLPQMDKTKGPVFMRYYVRNLIPSTCTAANQARLANAIEQYTDLSAGTKRALLKTQQDNQRCLNIAAAMSVH